MSTTSAKRLDNHARSSVSVSDQNDLKSDITSPLAPINGPQPRRKQGQQSRSTASKFPRARTNDDFNSPSSFTFERTSLPGSDQVMHTQSRLPPNTVARKAPRKAAYMPNFAIKGSTKATKSRFNRLPSQPQPSKSARSHTSPAAARKTSREKTRQRRPTKSITSQRNQAQVAIEEQHATPESIASSEATPNRNESSSTQSSTPCPETFIHRKMHTNGPSEPLQRCLNDVELRERPEPQIMHHMTAELASVKSALGQENWNEYLVLVRKFLIGEISDGDLGIREGRIFQVPNVAIRNRIKNMVLQSMTDQHYRG